MSHDQDDEALRDELSAHEMSDDQLSHVLGAASSQLTLLPGRALTGATQGKQALQLFPQRVPLINPDRTLAPLYQGFDFAGIHPDLEDPFPKEPPPPPKEPPIPPDLEDPFPPRPPTDFPFPAF